MRKLYASLVLFFASLVLTARATSIKLSIIFFFVVLLVAPAQALTVGFYPDNPLLFPDTVAGSTSTIEGYFEIGIGPDETLNYFGIDHYLAPFSASLNHISGPIVYPDHTAFEYWFDFSYAPLTPSILDVGEIGFGASWIDATSSNQFHLFYVDVQGAALAPPTTVPLPGTLSLLASNLGALGLLGWRRKRKAAALAA